MAQQIRVRRPQRVEFQRRTSAAMGKNNNKNQNNKFRCSTATIGSTANATIVAVIYTKR
jgi:hypothetical protein